MAYSHKSAYRWTFFALVPTSRVKIATSEEPDPAPKNSLMGNDHTIPLIDHKYPEGDIRDIPCVS